MKCTNKFKECFDAKKNKVAFKMTFIRPISRFSRKFLSFFFAFFLFLFSSPAAKSRSSFPSSSLFLPKLVCLKGGRRRRRPMCVYFIYTACVCECVSVCVLSLSRFLAASFSPTKENLNPVSLRATQMPTTTFYAFSST